MIGELFLCVCVCVLMMYSCVGLDVFSNFIVGMVIRSVWINMYSWYILTGGGMLLAICVVIVC